MSLIVCPECGKSISDRSQQCIHCGFPISDYLNRKKLYSISITSIAGGGSTRNRRIGIIADILEERYQVKTRYHMQDGFLEDYLTDLPKTVLYGIPYDYIDIVRKDLEATWCTVEIEECNCEEANIDFSKAIERVRKLSSKGRCPNCNSDQITTGSRGYSLLWGFLGSNKTVNRCGKCGYTWEPRRM